MNEREKREYELALRIGKKRFGLPCEHRKVKNGYCMNCLRRLEKRR